MTLMNAPCLSIAALLASGALAVPAHAQQPSTAVDGEWLSISGTVVSSGPENFVLDYGAKSIPVEMDDYDWYNENVMLPGDRVTVTGRLDNDFFENRKIEASSVHLERLHTTYFASAADEEEIPISLPPIWMSGDGEAVAFAGRVQSIHGESMTVDTGLYDYRVDVGSLDYNPFDSDGAQHVAIGDRVSIIGEMDDADLFDRREVDAIAVTELA